MKKFLTVIVVLLGIGTVLSLVLGNLPTFAFTGKGFLTTLANHQYDDAYALFSDEFKEQHPLEAFTEQINQTGLQKYESVEWTKTIVDKKAGVAAIVGIVTTKDGQHIPLQLRYIRITGNSWYDASWRIDNLRTGESASEGMY
jgi:hypothetical protein